MDTDERVLKAWGREWKWARRGSMGGKGGYVILSTIKINFFKEYKVLQIIYDVV